MAQATRLSLDEVRASVRRMQAEGERLVGRIRQDARALVERGARPNVRRLQQDVRQRAERTLKDIRAQRTWLADLAEQTLGQLAALVVRALRVPTTAQLAELTRRLGEIERRLDELSTKAA